jgi:hypothetical protein
MNLEQIVKETVAKLVAEKELTAAEEKKREEIVKAMKKDFKGPEGAMYAIATKNAKKLAESDPQTIAKISNAIEAGKIDPKEIEAAAKKAEQGNADDLAILMVNAMAGMGRFQENELNEDYEVAMAQDSLDSIIRAAMMLKAQMGDREVNLPAWIQDHITNSENYINQAAKGYHESDAQMDNNAGAEEMDEARFKKGEDVGGKGFEFKDIAKKAAKQYGSKEAGQRVAGAILKKVLNKEGEGYDFVKSAIESASGDKISYTEEDDYGRTIYWSTKNPNVNYFVGMGGEFEGKIYLYNGETGERYPIGDLKHYGDGQNHAADDDMHEAFQPKSSFDDYSIGDTAMLNGQKVKITAMEMDDETGERRARVRFEDGSVKDVNINSLDEAQEISSDELAQLQKTVDDTSKMPAERDAARNKIYASRAKKESQELDEWTISRWQHYAGIK